MEHAQKGRFAGRWGRGAGLSLSNEMTETTSRGLCMVMALSLVSILTSVAAVSGASVVERAEWDALTETNALAMRAESQAQHRARVDRDGSRNSAASRSGNSAAPRRKERA